MGKWMEECKICYDIIDQEKLKEIKCGHKTCQKCYLNLLICECPFCRTKIFYNHQDIKKRQQMGIVNNPDFSDNIVYNPNDFVDGNNINNRNNLSSTTFRESTNGNRGRNDEPNYILSRNSRRRHRRLIQEYNAVTNTQEQANERRRKRSNR